MFNSFPFFFFFWHFLKIFDSYYPTDTENNAVQFKQTVTSWLGNSKIPDLLGFSRHMKTMLKCGEGHVGQDLMQWDNKLLRKERRIE